MKKLYISLLFLTKLDEVHATLNEFGISNILPPKTSFAQDNQAFQNRIMEEMGDSKEVTLPKILDFLSKIQIYFDHLKDTNNLNATTIELARLALTDVQKTIKKLKTTQITAQDKEDIRKRILHLDQQINSYQ
jgi:hypothetical protein